MNPEQRAFVEALLNFLSGAEYCISAHGRRVNDMDRIERSIAARRAEFERLFPREGE